MRVFITGANGLTGTELVRLCLKNGHEVFSGYTAGEQPAGVPVRIDLTDAASPPPARSSPFTTFDPRTPWSQPPRRCGGSRSPVAPS